MKWGPLRHMTACRAKQGEAEFSSEPKQSGTIVLAMLISYEGGKSLLYVTEAIGPSPPNVEKTSGEKYPSSASKLESVMNLRGISRKGQPLSPQIVSNYIKASLITVFVVVVLLRVDANEVQ